MTEIRHLRCDRCDVDLVVDSRHIRSDAERGWAHCMIGLERLDFCPTCWRHLHRNINETAATDEASVTHDDRVLTFKDLKTQKGWPYTAEHTRRLALEGKVPKPFKTRGIGLNLWLNSEIDAYLAGQANLRRREPKP